MKTKKRILSLMASLLMVFSLFVCGIDREAFADEGPSATKAKRTIMMYVCGTDLETQAGMASYNLRQILRSNFSSDEDIRFIIMTGGTNTWRLEREYLEFPDEVDVPADAVSLNDPDHPYDPADQDSYDEDNKSQISNVYNQIWEAKGADAAENAGKMVLVDGDGVFGDGKDAMTSMIKYSDYIVEDGCTFFNDEALGSYEWMNDPEVLKAFIDFSVEYAPAEKYDLILWDHGQGAIGGFCSNEQEPSMGMESMTLDMIVDAMSDNAVTRDGGKFDFVDFDACLMNSVEVELALADYMDYYIASADVEPGYGQFYGPAGQNENDGRTYTGWLDVLGSEPEYDTFDLGKIIVDDFINFYDKESGDGSSQEGTLAVIDMNKLMTATVTPEPTEDDPEPATLNFVELLTMLTENLKGDIIGCKYYDEFRSFKSSIEYADMHYYDFGQLLSQLAYAFDDADLKDLTPDGNINDTNRYTGLACDLLSLLNDPEIMYARSTKGIHTDAQYYRDHNGTMQYGELGTSGMQIAFLPNEDPGESFGSYHQSMDKIIQRIGAKHQDRADFLKKHIETMEAYGLANQVGKAVSEMVSDGADKSTIDYEAVVEHWKTAENEYGEIAWDIVQNYIEAFGGEKLAEAWIEGLIPHMADEAIMKDRIQVLPESSSDGTVYNIKIDDVRKQAIDCVQNNLIAELPAAETFLNDETYADYTESIYGKTGELTIGSIKGSEVIEVDPETEGYEAAVEWLLTKGSTWKLGEPEEKWYALRAADGNVTAASVEIQAREIDVPTGYFTKELRPNYEGDLELQVVCNIVYLVFTKDADGGWELTEIDLQKEGGGWRAIPISEFVGEFQVLPLLEIEGDFSSCYIPISESSIKINNDTLKKIRLEYMNVSEIPDIEDMDGDGCALNHAVTVSNIYGHQLDITDLVFGSDDKSVSIKGAKVGLSKTKYTYNGKVKKPKIVKIKGKTLKEGTDYTAKWSDSKSKNVGTYTVTITGKGKYTGTTKAKYKIVPKGTSIKKLTKGRKAFTVGWKKQQAKMSESRITGYQIQFATDKAFTKNKRTVTVKGYRKVSKKVTKLKGGKKYYVRIRTYKTIKGVKYCSSWSKVKAVKTK